MEKVTSDLDVTKQLAEFTANLDYDGLPDLVKDRTKRLKKEIEQLKTYVTKSY